MVLIIRDGLRISLPVLNKFKQIHGDSLSNIWPLKQIHRKSTTWRNKWNRKKKCFVECQAPWLEDGIVAIKNIGLEILMYIQIFILMKAAFVLGRIKSTV